MNLYTQKNRTMVVIKKSRHNGSENEFTMNRTEAKRIAGCLECKEEEIFSELESGKIIETFSYYYEKSKGATA